MDMLEAIRSIVREEIQAETKPMKADITSLKSDVETVKENVEFTAAVLEKTLHLYDDLDQKWKAM
jgi:hypothetical protein